MNHLAQALLVANVLWDFVSAIAVWVCAVCESRNFIADAHVALWADEENRTNFAASALFAFLLVHWCCLRLVAVVLDWPQFAVWTYAMEALWVLLMVVLGRMHEFAGCAVVMLCVLCALVVLF